MRALVLLALAVGCQRQTPAPASDPPSTGAASTSTSTSASATSTSTSTSMGTTPDEHGPPEPVSLPAIAKLCATATCAGPFSRIDVWRLPTGKIHRYAHHGDIQRCSHPPMTVFDRDGTEVGAVPLEPVVPGSERAKEFDALREKLFGDAKQFDSAACPKEAP